MSERCPVCGVETDEDAPKCGNCGLDFGDMASQRGSRKPDLPVQSADVEDEPPRITGHKEGPGFRHPFEDRPEPFAEDEPEPPRSKFWPAAFGVLGVVALIVVIFARKYLPEIAPFEFGPGTMKPSVEGEGKAAGGEGGKEEGKAPEPEVAVEPINAGDVAAYKGADGWRFSGRVFHLRTLKPVSGAYLIYKDADSRLPYHVKTNKKGAYRASLPPSIDGYHLRIVRSGRDMNYVEDWIPSLRTIEKDKRLEVALETERRIQEPELIFAAGGQRVKKSYAAVQLPLPE